MLRLDPAFPPLWRSSSTLQLGSDPVIVFDDPEPWVERLIHQLERGVPDGRLGPVADFLGVTTDAVGDVVRRLDAVLQHPDPGESPVVALRVADGFATGDVAAFARTLGHFCVVESVEPIDAVLHTAVDPARTAVLIVHHLVDPRHAAALLRADIEHLPVVHGGRRATVGPLVQPGRTACLACLEAARRDADPAWPFLGAQLVGRAGGSPGPALSVETGIVAGRLVSARTRTAGTSVTVSADSVEHQHRAHRPHAACGCRSPEGSATADESPSPATTTPTASARRA